MTCSPRNICGMIGYIRAEFCYETLELKKKHILKRYGAKTVLAPIRKRYVQIVDLLSSKIFFAQPTGIMIIWNSRYLRKSQNEMRMRAKCHLLDQ